MYVGDGMFSAIEVVYTKRGRTGTCYCNLELKSIAVLV